HDCECDLRTFDESCARQTRWPVVRAALRAGDLHLLPGLQRTFPRQPETVLQRIRRDDLVVFDLPECVATALAVRQHCRTADRVVWLAASQRVHRGYAFRPRRDPRNTKG